MAKEEYYLNQNFDFQLGIRKDHPYYDTIRRAYEKGESRGKEQVRKELEKLKHRIDHIKEHLK